MTPQQPPDDWRVPTRKTMALCRKQSPGSKFLIYCGLKLDLDTCLTAEAQKWTDLSCRLKLSVWDGSGPEIEGSGHNFQITNKKKIAPRATKLR